MLHKTNSKVVKQSVEDTVRELLPEVSPKAHGVFVAMYVNNGLLNTQGMSITVDGRTLPVKFYPVLPGEEPENTVWIGYGVGNLE